jgi:hypothetical protein
MTFVRSSSPRACTTVRTMRAGVMWSLIPLAVLAGATTLAVPNSIAQGVPREPRTIDEMVAAVVWGEEARDRHGEQRR